MARRDISEINAGSMADIAFLLLIFFLVTTTMDIDAGISRKLPPKVDPNAPKPNIKEKNVFIVNVNPRGEILVEGNQYMKVNEIKDAAIKFLDNGGGLGKIEDGKPGKPCTWCKGLKDPASSDHPNKAVISLQSSRKTKHGIYIEVQNELVRAYNELRERESQRLYNSSFVDLIERAKKNPKSESLKLKVKTVKDLYPMILSEAEPVKL